MAPVVIPALAPSLDKSLNGDRGDMSSQSPMLLLGQDPRTRSWSLSPSRKVLTKTSHLPPSPHGSNDQTDCDPVL